AQGHYAVSWAGPERGRIAIAFDYHPPDGGLEARTNLYYLESPDWGQTWQTIDGTRLDLPLLDPACPALALDLQSAGELNYLHDLKFDAAGGRLRDQSRLATRPAARQPRRRSGALDLARPRRDVAEDAPDYGRQRVQSHVLSPAAARAARLCRLLGRWPCPNALRKPAVVLRRRRNHGQDDRTAGVAAHGCAPAPAAREAGKLWPMDGFHTDDDLPVPGWARHLGRQGYHTFLSLIKGYFRNRDIVIEIDQDEGLVRPVVRAAASIGVLGLQNIAQACRWADRDEWRDLIAAYFDSIFQPVGDDSALDVDMSDFARVRDRLRARLYPADIITHTSEIVQRAGPEGTLEALALDLPTTVRTVSRAEAEVWRLDPEDLLDIGRRNLRAAGRLTETALSLEQGARLKALGGDPYYAASHALFLDDYLPDNLPHGALVAIPRRDIVLLHEIRDMSMVEVMNAMLQLIIPMYHDGPGSLSPYMYWRRDGAFTVIPYEVDDDTLTLMPPDDFLELVEKLAESASLS
ncbi:MAG: hypothetical protein ACUVRU_01345, partial [Anaerolineae bacterium]